MSLSNQEIFKNQQLSLLNAFTLIQSNVVPYHLDHLDNFTSQIILLKNLSDSFSQLWSPSSVERDYFWLLRVYL